MFVDHAALTGDRKKLLDDFELNEAEYGWLITPDVSSPGNVERNPVSGIWFVKPETDPTLERHYGYARLFEGAPVWKGRAGEEIGAEGVF